MKILKRLRLIAKIGLVSLMLMLPKNAFAQETILWQAFQHAQVSFGQGTTLAISGMEVYAGQIFSENPELSRMIHQYSGPAATFIQQQLQTNPQFRTVVAENVYRIANYVFAPGGRQAGYTMAGELAKPSNWANLRAGSAGVGPIMVVAVGVGTLTISYQVGQRWLQSFQRMATKAEADAEAQLLGLMLARLNKGTVKLCNNISVEAARLQLQRRMRSHPTRPFKGIVCKADATIAQGPHPCVLVRKDSSLYSARWTWSSSTSHEVNGYICSTLSTYTKFNGQSFESFSCETAYYEKCKKSDYFNAHVTDTQTLSSGAIRYTYQTKSGKIGYGIRYLKGDKGF